MERFLKKYESIDLDFSSLLFFIVELVIASSEVKSTDINYSKSYFSAYYGIDLETFHKWIRVFCPDLWDNEYKRKRKFSLAEANYIFENLGRLSFDKLTPQSRKELMNEIYKGLPWKKSKCYRNIQLDLEDRFPEEGVKLNKMPPKFIFEILAEEKEEFDKNISSDKTEFYESQIQVLYRILTKYSNISDHKKEVHRRYFKIMLASSQKNNGVSKD